MRTHLSWALSGVLLGAIFTVACAREKQSVNQPPPYGTYPQQYPPQQYPPQQYPPQQYPPQQYPPQQAPPPATATATGTGIFGLPIPSGLPFPIPSGLPGFPPPATT
jgi:hypothetical protein